MVRYHGILGPAAKEREKMVPSLGPVEFGRSAAADGPREMDPSGIPRFGRLPWAVLLKRVRAGQTVYVVVDGYAGAEGSYSLEVKCTCN